MTTPPPYGQDPTEPPPPQDPYQQQPAAYPQPPTFQPPPAYPQPPTYQVSGPPTYPTSSQPYSPYAPPYSGGAPGYSGGGPGYGGFDPVTGQPYSDKSKVAAGLLQLLPGFFVGLGGIGRLYAGYTSLGVVQLVVSVLGYFALCCGGVLSAVTFGLALLVALPIIAGAWLWAIIDGIILLSGHPVDAQGRPLRP